MRINKVSNVNFGYNPKFHHSFQTNILSTNPDSRMAKEIIKADKQANNLEDTLVRFSKDDKNCINDPYFLSLGYNLVAQRIGIACASEFYFPAQHYSYYTVSEYSKECLTKKSQKDVNYFRDIIRHELAKNFKKRAHASVCHGVPCVEPSELLDKVTSDFYYY